MAAPPSEIAVQTAKEKNWSKYIGIRLKQIHCSLVIAHDEQQTASAPAIQFRAALVVECVGRPYELVAFRVGYVST